MPLYAYLHFSHADSIPMRWSSYLMSMECYMIQVFLVHLYVLVLYMHVKGYVVVLWACIFVYAVTSSLEHIHGGNGSQWPCTHRLNKMQHVLSQHSYSFQPKV